MSKTSKESELPKLEPGMSLDLELDLIEECALLKKLPAIAKNDPDVLGIADSISKIGLQYPLLVDPFGKLVDGRRRFRAAKRMQWEKVSVRVVRPDDVPFIIKDVLEKRAHMNKAQITFTFLPMLEPSFKQAWEKRMANLGQRTVETNPVGFEGATELPKPLEEWARELDVCVETLRQAYRIHRFFQDKTKRTLIEDGKIVEENVTFQEFYEPRLFRKEEPYSFKGILAGIGYQLDREKTGGKKNKDSGRPKSVEKKLGKFQETFKTFGTRLGYWEKFDDDTKEDALTPLDKTLEKIPDDLLETMSKKFNTELRRRKAAKEDK